MRWKNLCAGLTSRYLSENHSKLSFEKLFIIFSFHSWRLALQILIFLNISLVKSYSRAVSTGGDEICASPARKLKFCQLCHFFGAFELLISWNSEIFTLDRLQIQHLPFNFEPPMKDIIQYTVK
jgi:hypothetical protein